MGRPTLFQEIPCVKQMRLDPMPTALMLETVIGDALAPAPVGIYFRGRPDPVMVPEGVYHQHKVVNKQKTKETYVVKTIADLDRNMPVLDLDANLIVSPHQIPFLSDRPVLPTTALAIVAEAVADVIESRGVVEYRRAHVSPEHMYSKFIAEGIVKHQPELASAVVDQILGIVEDVCADVRLYCGNSPWVVHFLRKRHTELLIETSIDWRIIEYHRMTGTELRHYD